MERTRRDYLLFGAIAALTFILVLLLTDRVKSREDMSFSRALDTVNIGTTANDGTGDPLRTAFIKVNRIIIMLDSLDMELLTNDEMQALKDLEDLEDAVLFYVGDTTVTAAVGKVVFQTADSTFYGCRSTVATHKWYSLN
jgi:hypothetical protein